MVNADISNLAENDIARLRAIPEFDAFGSDLP